LGKIDEQLWIQSLNEWVEFAFLFAADALRWTVPKYYVAGNSSPESHRQVTRRRLAREIWSSGWKKARVTRSDHRLDLLCLWSLKTKAATFEAQITDGKVKKSNGKD
jgi:hypothetical protein